MDGPRHELQVLATCVRACVRACVARARVCLCAPVPVCVCACTSARVIPGQEKTEKKPCGPDRATDPSH